ncbi:MAG TPA: hypothetical protein VHY37_10570 [Tepidisphaeraceae bacterium]|jgi:hypothetical protein|nr:hypothetical protein [Tepidisphaeraceae bacterium]
MDTSGIIACTYGQGTFTVIDYTVRETPNIDKTLGARVGTFVRVEIDGEVRATDPATFSEELIATEEAFRIDGQDLTITGINGATEYFLPASGSIFGGPHCGFEMHRGDSMLSKKIKCIVTTQQGPGGGSSPANVWTVKTGETPDGLQTVTWAGTLIGVATMDYFLATVWPRFEQAYTRGALPLAGPGPIPGTGYWSLKGSTDLSQPTTNTTQTLKYTLTATQYFGPLPDDGNGNAAVEGTATQTVSRDEHYRLTTINEFDLLLDANSDPIKVLTYLRPTSGVILHETYKLSTLKENRLSGSFAQLASADAGELSGVMNFQQSATLEPQYTTWEEKRYVGAPPILIQSPQRLPRLTQSGSSVAVGKFFQPAALYPDTLIGQPSIELEDQNDLEKASRWTFQMIPGSPGSGGGLQTLTSFDGGLIARGNQSAAFYTAGGLADGNNSADGGGGSQ